jgi:hypothetical protein
VARDVIGYDAGKFPGGLSWQTLLLRLVDADDAWLISMVMLGLFFAATLWLSSRIDDLDRYLLLTLILFLCLSKVVLEQYLTWPIPWLAIVAFAPGAIGRRSSALLLAILTAIGCWDNETFHPWGRSSTILSLVLVAACAGYLAVQVRGNSSAGQRRPAASMGTLAA